MSGDSHNQSPEYWKGRYYTQLEQAEREEQRLRNAEDLLRRSLSRLSLAMQGADPALDQHLDGLRNAIREGIEPVHLSPAVEKILVLSAQLEQRRRQAPRQTPRDVLAGVLDDIRFPRGMVRKAHALRRRIGEHGGGELPKALTEEFVALVMESLAWATEHTDAEPPPEKAPGFLSRLLHGHQKASASPPSAPEPDPPAVTGARPSAADPAQLVDLLEPLARPEQRPALRQLRAQLSSTGDAVDLTYLVHELAVFFNGVGLHDKSTLTEQELNMIQGVLDQLLERLSLPTSLNAELTSIRKRLRQGLDPHALIPSLEAITQLITKAQTLSRQEKEELEGFLHKITRSLEEIERHLQHAALDQNGTIQDGRRLNESVEAQVQDIEISLREATDLDQLKHSIQARVTTIREQLDLHRQQDAKRFQEMEARFTSLKRHMEEAQGEASQLRDKLERQQQLAQRDTLTGLYNRQAYEERLAQEYDRWRRYKGQLSLVVIDIDHFKNVNDTYGHQAGDKVLKALGALLGEKLRTSDFLARYGGEEFVALMPETSLRNAMLSAEKLRQAVAQCKFHHSGQNVPVTLSCGIAEFQGADTPELVFQRADAALYQAKQRGRNRCVSQDDLPAGAPARPDRDIP